MSREFYSKAVLDASIILQTVVKEEHSDKTLSLLKTLKEAIVPSLLLYEVGNALVVLARRGFISKDELVRKFNYIASLPSLKICDVSFVKAIELALQLNITLYDACYLSLAIEAGAALITADKKLHEEGRKVAKVIHISEIHKNNYID